MTEQQIEMIAEKTAMILIERLKNKKASDHLMTSKDVAEFLQVSPSTLSRLRKNPGFPRPVSFEYNNGDRSSSADRWFKDDVINFAKRLRA